MRANQRWDLTGDTSWQNFCAIRAQAILGGKRFIAQLVDEKRSQDQNSLSHALYTQVAAQLDDQSVADVRAQCKLEHGVPILRAGDDKFRESYDKIVRPHDYETKLEFMAWFPVTSLMGKKQFTEYLDTVIRHYSQQGVSILMPGEA